MSWSVVFLALLTPVVDAAEKRVAQSVFNDDGQVLAEAPGENSAAFIKAWLDRESTAIPEGIGCRCGISKGSAG